MPLWSFLALLLVAAALLRDARAAGVAVTLLFNWALCRQLALITGDQFQWLSLAFIDFICVAALAGPTTFRTIVGVSASTSRIAGVVVLFYAVALTFHALYGLSDRGDWAQYRYWWRTHYVAWAQAWCLAVSEAWNGGNRVVRRLRADGGVGGGRLGRVVALQRSARMR